jgi:beta-1,4-mannosyl-glycoprotein beta-1,4-N-acetylglucosaminyltransferase
VIYDTFIFFNELELLELRLHELAPVVVKFVLVEATRTIRAKPKPLYFAENQHAFRAFRDKLAHVVVEDMPEVDDPSRLERFQRDCARRALTACQPDDIILLSDADEIPRADTLREAARTFPFRRGTAASAWHSLLKQRLIYRTFRNIFKKWHPFVRVFQQQYRVFFLNCMRGGNLWDGTRMIHYRDWSTGGDMRHWKGARIKNGGWHFTWMGGPDRIESKLRSFSHPELDTPEFRVRLNEALQEQKHFGGQRAHLRFEKIDGSYPAYLQQHPERFKDLLREP